MAITLGTISDITRQIGYKPGFTLNIGADGEHGPYWMQWACCLPDYDDPGNFGYNAKGRKWRISKHMTASEIVQTALMAAIAFEEHEAREAFTFGGKRCYGPHIDVHELVCLADKLEVRT